MGRHRNDSGGVAATLEVVAHPLQHEPLACSFGYLVYKSGFLPWVLGILLMLGCFGYLIDFLGIALVPGYSESVIASYASLPGTFGEIGTCLWLLFMNVAAGPQTKIDSSPGQLIS